MSNWKFLAHGGKSYGALLNVIVMKVEGYCTARDAKTLKT